MIPKPSESSRKYGIKRMGFLMEADILKLSHFTCLSCSAHYGTCVSRNSHTLLLESRGLVLSVLENSMETALSRSCKSILLSRTSSKIKW